MNEINYGNVNKKNINIDLLTTSDYIKKDPKEREHEKKKYHKVNPDRLAPMFQDVTRIKVIKKQTTQ